MKNSLFSLLLFVAVAKGRVIITGSGSTGGFSIDDGWNAPGQMKVSMGFGIIWAILSLIQILLILANFRAMSWPAHGPYIVLAFSTLCYGLASLLFAIMVRLTCDWVPAISDASAYLSSSSFLQNVDSALRPAVVLYLLHQRGGVLQAVHNNAITLLSTQLWKRILDWVLVVLCFVMYTASMGLLANSPAIFRDGFTTYFASLSAYQASVNLGYAGIAFSLFLCIDIFVSLVFQGIQAKGRDDLITSRLLTMIIPLIVLYMVDLLFFTIANTDAGPDIDPLDFTLSFTIVDGCIRLAIGAALIHTMTLSGVLWTPKQPVAPGTAISAPGNMWPNPSPSLNQPVYNPQQQQFHPQFQPPFQYMHQQPPYPPPS